MKHDLLHAYFERDLTSAEEGHLAKLLEESAEAATQFAALAEQEYRKSGYPRPRQGQGSLRTRAWWVLQALVAGGLAICGWRWFQSLPVVSLPPAAEPRVSEDAMPPSVKVEADEEKPGVPVKIRKAPAFRPVPRAVPRPAQTSLPAKLEVAVEGGNHFKMVVELGQNNPVDLRILDAAGRTGRLVYHGKLYAGRWAFEWNGILSDGQKAPAGRYKVALDAGKDKSARWVEIEKVEIRE